MKVATRILLRPFLSSRIPGLGRSDSMDRWDSRVSVIVIPSNRKDTKEGFVKKVGLLIALLLFAVTGLLQAQTQSAPASGGWRADWKQQVNDATEKILQLAEAVPAEKYGWKPSEGVRTVSEVYVHIAGGSYFLPTFMG